MPDFLLPGDPVPSELLSGFYDPVLVALSFLVAAAASYSALLLMARFRSTGDEKRRRRLVVAAALCMGGGIWSMHFIGMLAFHLPVDVIYRFVPTLFSFLLAVGITFHAFRNVCGVSGCIWRSGSLMGLGVFVMHGVGALAMQFPGTMMFRADLLVVSLLIAIGAATAALWLALNLESSNCALTIVKRIAASLVMALAVTGMHYTGMAATVFVPLPETPFAGRFTLDGDLLAYGTVVMAGIVLSLAVITSSAVETLSSRKRLAALILIMTTVAFTVALIALYSLYQAGFEQQRERLVEIAKSQARLMDAIGRFDKQYSNNDVAGGAFAATLGQIRDAHVHFKGFGETGEFAVGMRKENEMVFLIAQRSGADALPSLPFESRLGQPMHLALSGKSGTMVGVDYRGIKVLAAYEPVLELGLGLVAKIDMVEIRAPFIEAGLMVGGASIVAVLFGAWLFLGISNPMIHRLEREIADREAAQIELAKSREDLVKAEEVAHLGNWVWELKTGEVRWSDQAYRILGFTPGQFKNPAGQFEKAVHPADVEMVDRAIDHALETGQPYELEHRIIWPDGAVRYIYTKADVSLDSEGKPQNMVGTVQDITERKIAQEEVQRLTLEKEKIEYELEFAKLVQEGFLPEKPPSPPGYLFAATSTPAKFVGGDFYDFIDLGQGRLGLVLGDVSGKGVSAALFMAQLLSDLRYVSLVEPDPGRIFAKVNDIQCRRSRRGMFATAVYLLLDQEKRTVSAANAGHPPILISAADGSVRKEGLQGGTPLGILPGTEYQRMEFKLQRGETVLLFTDGVTEALDSNSQPFGLTRLIQVMINHSQGTPEELITNLQGIIAQFRFPEDPSDDLTLLGFKVL